MGDAAWHSLDPEEVAVQLGVGEGGLAEGEARERLARFGRNEIPSRPPTPSWRIFVQQFESPLIYILVIAALLALVAGEVTDAAFIAAVLLLNAVIGFVNQARAERAIRSLGRLLRSRALVERGHRVMDVDAEDVVPGDLVLLEPGSRVCCDLRLLEAESLRIDESLLTGESFPVEKGTAPLAPTTGLADRRNMAFGGTLVIGGRGVGRAVATGVRTQVGDLAMAASEVAPIQPPLMRRMARFARRLGIVAIFLSLLVVGLGFLHGEPLRELVMGAVALAVSAIPEGLPVALTVALAVAVSRMARRGVIVRQLPSVEALGSCTVVATDKTGTLTKNELTVETLRLHGARYQVSGVGYAPEGDIASDGCTVVVAERPALFRFLRAACLANEGTLAWNESQTAWEWAGDPTDVALLACAIKGGLDPVALRRSHPQTARIPFEPELRYAASFHTAEGDDGTGGALVCVKGAPERVLAMCDGELGADGSHLPLDPAAWHREVDALMNEGYRVMGIADAPGGVPHRRGERPPEPSGLTFIGLVAMTDPPREGVAEAVERCLGAGVRVVMVTGDHPRTAEAIGRRVGIPAGPAGVLSGERLEDDALAAALEEVTVVARAAPRQKLRVVSALQERGHFVAVTGDGVNDAPALRQANIGVAMGRSGTDVAREAADLVITDDDFATIVAGVEEGRYAYDNVRKVTYLLISTGLGEVLMVVGALALGFPVPFTAVQLLWLNLVTNGIQDVALAFEPGEPGALARPPRPPAQGIFERLMIERTLLAGLVFSGVGLACFSSWLGSGASIAQARNLVVQLFVAFEIFHIGNSRSERISLLRLDPRINPVLLIGTLTALGVHLLALNTPFFQHLLGVTPIRPREWLVLVAAALSILVVMEAHKAWWSWRTARARRRRSSEAA